MNEGMRAFMQVSSSDPVCGDEVPLALAARVMSHFDIATPLEAYDFPEKGNIHQHTFVIRSGSSQNIQEYLLQRINQQVFARPADVMKAMAACLEIQRLNMAREGERVAQGWEPIRLIPTRSGAPYLRHENRRGKTYWRMMVRIPDCTTFKNLGEIPNRKAQLALAEETGRGLAIYGDLTADMAVSGLASSLPGYRDTRIYYNQLRSVLRGNRTEEEAGSLLPLEEVLRQSTLQHFLVHLPQAEAAERREDSDLRPFISLAEENEEYAMLLLREMESGRIRTVAIHGDTKLDNFLFCSQSGRVKSLVDLDTIMPHTWLADWGDMVRSLVNVAGEKERNLDKVDVDIEIYEALARGFLQTAHRVTREEIDLMVDGVQIIALELGVRFLADHLRGDSYFKLNLTDPPDMNKYRAMVQLRLFERLKEKSDEARQCIARWA